VAPDPRQTFDGFGLSQPRGDRTWALLPESVQTQGLDLAYKSLAVDYFRAWLWTDPSFDTAKMVSDFKASYVESGLLPKIMERCQPKLILAPSPGSDQTTLSAEDYAKQVANCISALKSDLGLQFEATGIINEPSQYPSSYIAEAACRLREELDSAGLQNIKITAADWANVDEQSVQALLQIGSDVQANQSIQAWSNHSYNMASTMKMANAAHLKERWVTEAGQFVPDSAGPAASVNAMDAPTLAARFLTDLNQGVTRWMYFIGFINQDNHAPENPVHALVVGSPSGSITVFNRYYYLSELLGTFRRGTVVYSCTSSLDGAMEWTYGQKPRLSAACGQGADGRMRIAIANTTGIVSSAISTFYPTEAFQIGLDLPWSNKTFTVSAMGQDAIARNLGVFDFENGQRLPTIEPLEMLTLVQT
jgi:hypothetical protein